MWKFDQPENCATIISKSILRGQLPILLVLHDADDDGWLFLDGQPFDPEGIAIVALREAVELDTSVIELASMQPGWQAYRNSLSDPWIIEQSPDEYEEDET